MSGGNNLTEWMVTNLDFYYMVFYNKLKEEVHNKEAFFFDFAALLEHFGALLSILLLAIYPVGQIFTFGYLIYLDWPYFNWWNWIIFIGIAGFQSMFWPFFWAMAYYFDWRPDSFLWQLC